MLNLVAIHMEDPNKARAIAKIKPHPVSAFGFSCVLILGSLLSGLVVRLEPGLSNPASLALVGGILGFVVAWIPFTLCLHGMCRLLGYRADYGSLQTQVALALWPLAILPPVGLVQFLLGTESKIIFCGTAFGAFLSILIFLRQAIIANYGMTRPQANIALIGSFLTLTGFIGLLLAGVTSAVLLLAVASAIL